MRDDVIGMYLLTGQNPQNALTTDHAARVLTLDANLSQLRLQQQRLRGGAQRVGAGPGVSSAPVFPSPQRIGAAAASLGGTGGGPSVSGTVSSTGQVPGPATSA